ncbi:hypothetical protein [Streptomyces sp. NPDC002133]
MARPLRHSPALCPAPVPGTGSLAHPEENPDAAAIPLSDEDMCALEQR